jgi:hypothetical protein
MCHAIKKISAVRLEMVVCDSSFLREGRTRRQAGLNGHRGMIFRDGNFWRLLSEVKKKITDATLSSPLLERL